MRGGHGESATTTLLAETTKKGTAPPQVSTDEQSKGRRASSTAIGKLVP